jgi:hypothetical protein
MYYLRSYPKSFPFRTSASWRSTISSFHFRASSASPFFSAFPYKICLTPLSTAFTHLHGVGWVCTFSTFRHSDLATFRPSGPSDFPTLRRSDHSDVQTLRTCRPLSFHHLTNSSSSTSLFARPSALPGLGGKSKPETRNQKGHQICLCDGDETLDVRSRDCVRD